MSDYTILQHCSPTLAGIKTGNLVTCSFRTREEVAADLRRWNRMLRGKGIRVIPLKYMAGRVLLYLYRPDALRRDLGGRRSSEILRSCGYESSAEQECIRTLIRHLRESGSFPHEIGLFIGYPPEDVVGFIENGGRACKFSGMWKVYGDVNYSKQLFEKYRRCTEVFTRLGRAGRTIEQLSVAAKGRES